MNNKDIKYIENVINSESSDAYFDGLFVGATVDGKFFFHMATKDENGKLHLVDPGSKIGKNIFDENIHSVMDKFSEPVKE